ncbi:MAG: translational GTPase TypA [Clostridia bacterium]|jgi:GTP-binding protein|nr:translational GTPase TypA [Clostridia bacterium]MBO7666635.1 translational GTPase TypA [Clostridia bacterium]MBQ6182966.1 translational GTPase TypA [Clostridia bacterium]
MIRNDLRNIAIIAHVDHGKTTLVDQMLKYGGLFRENQQVEERVMDSNALERERGITILAKNTSTFYKGVKINIVDTPGHADFGGEVERILKMVNGVLLLVDAAEGPMPQTRFVLKKAIELNHRIIVVINKIDRPDARVYEVPDEVLELLMELDASNDQLDSPVIFCCGRGGTASLTPEDPGTDLAPLFDTILEHIAPPEGDETAPAQMLVSSVDYNDYVGKIAIGRIERGTFRLKQEISVCDWHDKSVNRRSRITSLFQIDGLGRTPVEEAKIGDIVCLSGLDDINIGNTITDKDFPEPLPFVKIGEPTMEMTFSVNNSPFAGQEGKYVTTRHIRDYLFKEAMKDMSLKVYETDSSDSYNVCGRGEMHLSILMENMRREGYEFCVSTPRIIYREIDGVKCEPVERAVFDVPSNCVSTVMEKMGYRKGTLEVMQPKGDRMHLEFFIPTRGLFGYKTEFLSDTKGEGIFSSVFEEYQPVKGEIARRFTGSLIAYEEGECTSYGIFNSQDRGPMFVVPAERVYGGQVVGISTKGDDIVVNVCKKKHLTAVRSTGADEALRLTPVTRFSLEEALEFIADDELIEITPKSMRIRKRILDNSLRMKEKMKDKK